MSTQSNEVALEVIQPGALEAITRGEIDTQISTAHKYPRSMATFKRRATDMATIDQQTAESCIYCRPVGKKDGKMQYAEGLSVRMAEIVGASYGNLRVGSMIVEQTERYVVTRGFAHDLESNFASTSEVKEPTVTKEGKPFSEGMRAVIAKAALSKARRDATFQVVPKALCRPVEIAARQLIAGDAKSMDQRKAAAVQYIQRLNIEPARVWAALSIQGEDDLTSDILLTLTGIRNAIKDGEATIDEAFPVIMATGSVGSTKPAATDPSAGKTVTELAQTEAAKTQQTPVSTPEAAKNQAPPEPTPPVTDKRSAGPSAESLRKQILAKGTDLNAGKVKIQNTLRAMGWIKPEDTLENLDASTLAHVIDGWEQVADAIKNPPEAK